MDPRLLGEAVDAVRAAMAGGDAWAARKLGNALVARARRDAAVDASGAAIEAGPRG